jgi:NADH-quinone oxidoreductase subunit G
MADPVATSHHATAPSGDEPVTFLLDGKEVTATNGEFLIAAAERAGVFIPRFCYHPRMKPVGMCRMCLVEVSGPRGATLQPACYVPVADGMEVDTTSEKVKKAQDGVLEFLLVNHPLDCPVCDKGGECPLQDQVLSYGPGESRFLEEKRHWAKPMPISDLVLLDRERCIQCGRCTRFAAEIAGEAQIDFVGRGDHIEVGVFAEHPFSSYFSGNTVQICPVGALTASAYRFTARPWDVEQAESTCTTCAVGCRVAVQSSGNRLTRLLGIDSDPVNQSWLCDKGRFGYEASNAANRLVEPMVRGAGSDESLAPASWASALGTVADRLSAIRKAKGPGAIGVLGGARLSNEDAYAWAKLAKGVLGTDSVDAQLGDGLPAELVLGVPRATIDEACAAKVVVVLAGDLREELPVLHLRLRSAAVDQGLRIVELAARPSALTPHVAASVHCRPGDAPGIAANLVAGTHPGEGDDTSFAAALDALRAAGDGGEGIVVVVGRPSLAEHEQVVAKAAATFADAWPRARFLPALRRGNVMGALDMGLAPGVLPGRVSLEDGAAWFTSAWGAVPSQRGKDAGGILAALADGTMEAVVLLGADPLGDFPDRGLAVAALEKAAFVVAVDAFLSPSAAAADVVLPAAAAHEKAGSTTNIEGRVTRLGQKLVPPGQAWPDWMIAAELAERLGGDLGAQSVADLWDEVERLAPAHTGVTREALHSPGAGDGVLVPLPAAPVRLGRRSAGETLLIDPIATPGIDAVERQGAPLRSGAIEAGVGQRSETTPRPPAGDAPSRPALLSWPVALGDTHVPPPDSYSLRLVARRRLYDDGILVAACGSLEPLVPAAELRANPYDLDRLGVTTGGKVRVRSARGVLVLDAVADPGIPRGIAAVDFNLDGGNGGAADLVAAQEAVTDVRLETA